MKGSRFNFRKALMWIGGIVLTGLVGLIVAPGNIEGIYSSQDSGCLCGHRNFMRFHNGNVILYNTGHAPAHWAGTYRENGDGTVTSEVFEGGTTLSEPRLLFFRTLESTDRASGWDFRIFPTDDVQGSIQHQNIEKTVISSIGLEEIEVYDSDMRFIERKWF